MPAELWPALDALKYEHDRWLAINESLYRWRGAMYCAIGMAIGSSLANIVAIVVRGLA